MSFAKFRAFSLGLKETKNKIKPTKQDYVHILRNTQWLKQDQNSRKKPEDPFNNIV